MTGRVSASTAAPTLPPLTDAEMGRMLQSVAYILTTFHSFAGRIWNPFTQQQVLPTYQTLIDSSLV